MDFRSFSFPKKLLLIFLLISLGFGLINGFSALTDYNPIIAMVGLYAIARTYEIALLLYASLCFFTFILDIIRIVVCVQLLPANYYTSWVVFTVIGWVLKVVCVVLLFFVRKEFSDGTGDSTRITFVSGGVDSNFASPPNYTPESVAKNPV